VLFGVKTVEQNLERKHEIKLSNKPALQLAKVKVELLRVLNWLSLESSKFGF